MNEVWIVDDDRSIRWVLEKVLTKAGSPAGLFLTEMRPGPPCRMTAPAC